jgi:hypothetical protein
MKLKWVILLLGINLIFAEGAFAANVVTKVVEAENQWTNLFSPTYQNTKGNMNISVIYGDTGSATVKLQRTFNGGVTWGEVKTYTESAENMLEDLEAGSRYRIGVPTGNYFAGSITVRLSN